MKIRSLLPSLLLLCVAVIAPPLKAEDNLIHQLGPVGGTFQILPGSSFLHVLSVTPGGPGATAGLQANDYIFGAFGETFGVLGLFSAAYTGSVQDYGEAIERAESGNVLLPLKVERLGVGALTITVNLPNVGAFGGAYPLGSPKYDTLYEYAIARMHTLLIRQRDSA